MSKGTSSMNSSSQLEEDDNNVYEKTRRSSSLLTTGSTNPNATTNVTSPYILTRSPKQTSPNLRSPPASPPSGTSSPSAQIRTHIQRATAMNNNTNATTTTTTTNTLEQSNSPNTSRINDAHNAVFVGRNHNSQQLHQHQHHASPASLGNKGPVRLASWTAGVTTSSTSNLPNNNQNNNQYSIISPKNSVSTTPAWNNNNITTNSTNSSPPTSPPAPASETWCVATAKSILADNPKMKELFKNQQIPENILSEFVGAVCSSLNTSSQSQSQQGQQPLSLLHTPTPPNAAKNSQTPTSPLTNNQNNNNFTTSNKGSSSNGSSKVSSLNNTVSSTTAHKLPSDIVDDVPRVDSIEPGNLSSQSSQSSPEKNQGNNNNEKNDSAASSSGLFGHGGKGGTTTTTTSFTSSTATTSDQHQQQQEQEQEQGNYFFASHGVPTGNELQEKHEKNRTLTQVISFVESGNKNNNSNNNISNHTTPNVRYSVSTPPSLPHSGVTVVSLPNALVVTPPGSIRRNPNNNNNNIDNIIASDSSPPRIPDPENENFDSSFPSARSERAINNILHTPDQEEQDQQQEHQEEHEQHEHIDHSFEGSLEGVVDDDDDDDDHHSNSTDDPDAKSPSDHHLNSAMDAVLAVPTENQLVESPGYQQIGDYILTLRIGDGATSTVWQATQISDPTQVFAMKVIRKSRVLNRRQPKDAEHIVDPKIRKEIAVMQSVSANRNVVKFYEALQCPHSIYLRMQIASHHLFDVEEETGYCYSKFMEFEEKTALKYFCQVADAVQFMNLRGLVHRDIKPNNVLFLKTENRVLLADFGVAEVTNETGTKYAGTPSFLPPEKIWAQPEETKPFSSQRSTPEDEHLLQERHVSFTVKKDNDNNNNDVDDDADEKLSVSCRSGDGHTGTGSSGGEQQQTSISSGSDDDNNNNNNKQKDQHQHQHQDSPFSFSDHSSYSISPPLAAKLANPELAGVVGGSDEGSGETQNSSSFPRTHNNNNNSNDDVIKKRENSSDASLFLPPSALSVSSSEHQESNKSSASHENNNNKSNGTTSKITESIIAGAISGSTTTKQQQQQKQGNNGGGGDITSSLDDSPEMSASGENNTSGVIISPLDENSLSQRQVDDFNTSNNSNVNNINNDNISGANSNTTLGSNQQQQQSSNDNNNVTTRKNKSNTNIHTLYAHKHDAWSLGVVLYCMIYGKHPFDLECIEQSVLCPIEFPDTAGNGTRVSETCRNLMQNMLLVDPAERWSARRALQLIRARRRSRAGSTVSAGGMLLSPNRRQSGDSLMMSPGSVGSGSLSPYVGAEKSPPLGPSPVRLGSPLEEDSPNTINNNASSRDGVNNNSMASNNGSFSYQPTTTAISISPRVRYSDDVIGKDNNKSNIAPSPPKYPQQNNFEGGSNNRRVSLPDDGLGDSVRESSLGNASFFFASPGEALARMGDVVINEDGNPVGEDSKDLIGNVEPTHLQFTTCLQSLVSGHRTSTQHQNNSNIHNNNHHHHQHHHHHHHHLGRENINLGHPSSSSASAAAASASAATTQVPAALKPVG